MSTQTKRQPTNQLIQQIGGETHLQGRLDFTSVPKLWHLLQQQIHTTPDFTLDLSQVEYADSAALVLLLQAQQEAGQQAGKLALKNIPQDLLDLARLSNVDKLLAAAT